MQLIYHYLSNLADDYVFNVSSTVIIKSLPAFLLTMIGTSPFSEGLIVVMDGMGETYKAMLEDIAGVEVPYDTVQMHHACIESIVVPNIMYRAECCIDTLSVNRRSTLATTCTT